MLSARILQQTTQHSRSTAACVTSPPLPPEGAKHPGDANLSQQVKLYYSSMVYRNSSSAERSPRASGWAR